MHRHTIIALVGMDRYEGTTFIDFNITNKCGLIGSTPNVHTRDIDIFLAQQVRVATEDIGDTLALALALAMYKIDNETTPTHYVVFPTNASAVRQGAVRVEKGGMYVRH